MKIKITDSEGAVLTGTAPTGWHNIPLAPYTAVATAATMPERCTAVAQLLGLPPEPFLADVSLLLPIKAACPWLLDGSLPEATGPVPVFEHLGTRYVHVGNLETVTAEQFEALLGFLQEHEGKPLAAAPSLLAVLYCPAGQPQTADVVEAAAKAFETLPMGTAWPALDFFLRSGVNVALRIQTVWALESQLHTLLETLEAATAPAAGASSTLWQRMRRSLTRTWIRHAKKALR